MKKTFQNDLTQKHSKGIIAIHWITALLIIFLFLLGKYMSVLEPSEKMGLIQLHAVVGILVFILTIVRTWIFFKSPRPADLNTGSTFNNKLVIGVHNTFYILLFGLSLSGIAILVMGGYGEALKKNNPDLIKNSSEIASLEAHEIMALMMILLLLIHVIGVIKHYVVTKENTLKRIF
jgi:cytochrome b561